MSRLASRKGLICPGTEFARHQTSGGARDEAAGANATMQQEIEEQDSDSVMRGKQMENIQWQVLAGKVRQRILNWPK
jgi:hypothetical protein